MANSPDPDALLRTARTHLALGRDAEAAAAFEQALTAGVGTARDHFDLGVLLHRLDRLTNAIEHFERASQQDPNLREPFLNLARTRLKIGDPTTSVRDFDAAIERGAGLAAVSDRLLALNYVPDLTEESVAEEHFRSGARFGKEVRSRENFESLRREPSTSPIRIGILSSDLRSHPIGWFLRPVLPRLRGLGFEILAYSSTPSPDEVTAELRSASSMWRDCLDTSDDALEQTVVGDRPHVLLDTSGHTARNRMSLMARRLAPVQLQWIGYPNTTGVEAVDFTIGDPVETPPDAHRHFSEAIATMPDGYLCYVPPEDATPRRRSPATGSGRPTFGNLGNPAKINDAVLELWSRTLAGVPDGRLLLAYGTYIDAGLRERIARRFGDAGIDPDRIDFRWGLSPQETRATYAEVDIALDTFPYSGGLTTCEAITCGVPVVSMPGRGFAGRHSATHLVNAGLGEWVVESDSAYVERAVAAAEEHRALAERCVALGDEIRRSPLCDADRFSANLAKAIRHAVAHWRDGAPPESFEVAKID